MDKLLLIDGNSIINRAYFALPPLNDDKGRNVNAVYGFINILFKAISDISPTKLVVTFDKRGDNFRKKIYAEYKANRKGMPDDLAEQMPILHNLLSSMRVKVVESAGIEADDIIGTLSKKFQFPTYIVSGDRDMLQLVDDTTSVILTKRGVSEIETVNIDNIVNLYGLTPTQIIEYKALRGDTSDNIPGVKGVGEKTAMSLLDSYKTLDGVYEHLSDVKGAMGDKLAQGKEMAYISKVLATIVTDVEVDCDLQDCNLPTLTAETKAQFDSLNFRGLISKLTFEQALETKGTVAVPKEIETIIVDNLQQLSSLVSELSNKDIFAIFISKDITVAYNVTKEYKITISENFLDGINFEQAISLLKPLFEGNSKKIIYDSKLLRHTLDEYNIAINNICDDVCLMQYLVEYSAYKDFQSLKTHYDLLGEAVALFNLRDILYKQLVDTNTQKLYTDIEMPLANVLYHMEKDGVKVDCDYLNKLSIQFTAQIKDIESEIFALAGVTFNISSPKQLSEVLFVNLGLTPTKKTKSGYSTDNDVLMSLRGQHDIIDKIVTYRQLTKLNGTYIEGLKPLIKDGFVHTTYNQALTSTGRLSSSDPNLQNIPVRNEMGKEIRKLFIPQFDILVGADYSQIELRLLASFSGDENMLSAFNSGKDIHALVASELLNVPLSMVTSAMRRMAKAVNFGIIYGISSFGLAQNTGVTQHQAKEFIEKYFARYPKIKEYLDSSVTFAREHGYVVTITGRRRQLPEIKSSNGNLRNFGERAAMNMPLQGSAADIMKEAMINVYNRLQREKLISKIIMQVHDELIIDTKQEEVEKVENILREEMENVRSLKCKLSVNLEKGNNLYESK